LVTLDLNENKLKGTLPDLSQLSQLVKLNLWGNQLEGTLPNLLPLSKLVTLDLGNNYQLSGPLPDLSQFPLLETAVLWNNKFTGPIPALPDSLLFLGLSGNQLSGAMPQRLPPKLQGFWVGDNPLQPGPIPELHDNLEEFRAENCQLTGTIPELPANLRDFGVERNQLTGQIPKLPANLESFDAGYNQLTGTIPELPANLRGFYANDNQLTGTIPTLPASLGQIWVENNFLTGPIPAFPSTLDSFDVAGNFLTGLPPAPNSSLYSASMCPNRLDGPSTPGAPDWTAVTFYTPSTKWTDDCAPTTSATVTVDNTAEGGSIACPTSVPYAGGSCTVTPDAGYAFAKELVFDPVDAAAVEACTDTGCTILVKGGVTVKAVFTKAPDPTPTPDPDPAPTPNPTPAPYHDDSSPTMGELGLLLSGLALAGAAAPALRRRERKGRKQD
ncbi:MAG: hypothetical protein J6T92_08305, partial [Ottowia sp.]|nr:hypothetical protein [Ottowia sp.]